MTNLLFSGPYASSATSLPSETIDAVLRYKLDLGSRYTLGAIATSREGGSYHNTVGGVDGSNRPLP